MVDRISPEKRSWNMSRVRNKDTSPERLVRSALHKMGYRFRLHRKDLPGHPDIVLPKYRTAILVNGCFWHQHKGCTKAALPATNVAFWKEKFESNIRRDKQNRRLLSQNGWRVLILWECHLTNNREVMLRWLKKRIETGPNSARKWGL